MIKRLLAMGLASLCCATVAAGAPPTGIPAETKAGFRTDLSNIPMSTEELYADSPTLQGATDEGIREMLSGFIDFSSHDLERRGRAKTWNPSIGPREVRVSRYFHNAVRFLMLNSFTSDAGPAKALRSDMIEAIILGTVSDITILDTRLYGTEVAIEVSEYLKSPTRRTPDSEVRIRLLSNRLVHSPVGVQGEVRSVTTHEPDLRIGDEVILYLSLIPMSTRQLIPSATLDEFPELLYKTEIKREEGFYELVDLGIACVVEDNYVTVRSPFSEPKKVSLNEHLALVKELLHQSSKRRQP